MQKKVKTLIFLLIIIISFLAIVSCEIHDAYNFQEGIYKSEDVELTLYEDITITGISIELKEIEKAESDNNTLKNFRDNKFYEVKLIFIINNEEVLCDFINLYRLSPHADVYEIEANVSDILNTENASLTIMLEPTRIDDPYGKDRRATRMFLMLLYLYKDEEIINKSLENIVINLDYVFDESKNVDL